jgi:hypothetical protein
MNDGGREPKLAAESPPPATSESDSRKSLRDLMTPKRRGAVRHRRTPSFEIVNPTGNAAGVVRIETVAV